VQPKPPPLTLCGRPKVYNGQPTLGQTDLQTYLDWCNAGPEYAGTKSAPPGVYQLEESVVDKLSSPAFTSTWFQRTLTPLNTNIIRTHLRAAVDTAVDVANTRERIEVANEAGRNLTTGCKWCDFQGLCRAEMVGGPDGTYDLADYKLRERE